ncbi:MAG: methionyl-tRNA formyltransferase [Patescibacteria group bacterium]
MNSKNKINLIFFGTAEFGISSLKKILSDRRFNILAIITQPDKKIGRKQITTSPPIKLIANQNQIPILQPKNIIDIKNQIIKINPDLAILIAYGQIIPKEILDIPKLGFINVHGSILPKYRGAACLQAPILNGDKFSGISIMKMDKGLDTGPIIKQEKIALAKSETADSLHNKLANLAAEILPDIIIRYSLGKIKLQPQKDKNTSYIKKLTKEDGKISWQNSAEKIECQVRAFYPWPGSYTKLENKILKIIKVNNKILKINKHKIGTLFLINSQLAMQCGKNALIIEKLQLEGKKIITAEEFIKGYSKYIN